MATEYGKVAQRGPFVQKDVAAGDYWWCTCGLASPQPLCDGSHKAERRFAPLQVTFEAPMKTVAWCGCKRTARPPHCDGAHGSIQHDED